MAAIYHPQVVTIVPHYDVGSGRDAVNVTHWKAVGTLGGAGGLAAIQAAFNTAWDNQWHTFATSSTKYLGCWVIDSSSATGGQVTNTGFTPHAGQQLGGALGDQVAALLSLSGLTRYRGGHSRLYIPGVDLTKVAADGRTLTGGISIIEQMYDDTVAAMDAVSSSNGGPLTPIIWHKKWAANPNSIEDVAHRICQPILATQRRRIRKVSRHKKKV
jgi:hypothetical protein